MKEDGKDLRFRAFWTVKYFDFSGPIQTSEYLWTLPNQLQKQNLTFCQHEALSLQWNAKEAGLYFW